MQNEDKKSLLTLINKLFCLPLQQKPHHVIIPMDHLPRDPFMLLSAVNMLLRDGEYDSLSDLCSALDADEDDLCYTLAREGYAYVPDQRQFRPLS